MFKSKIVLAIRVLKIINANPGISAAKIAERCSCSTNYLEQVFPALQGYVEGKRGRHGGYCMRVSYEAIHLADLAKALGYPDEKIYTHSIRKLRVSDCIH